MTTALYHPCMDDWTAAAFSFLRLSDRGVVAQEEAGLADTIAPNTNPALSQLCPQARRILGQSGMARFNEFWNLKEGWYPGGGGKQLSRRAILYFNRFCTLVPELPSVANLFMGLDGSLEITWRNTQGQVFDIEFFDDRIGYYFEKTGEEAEVNPASLQHLLNQLRRSL